MPAITSAASPLTGTDISPRTHRRGNHSKTCPTIEFSRTAGSLIPGNRLSGVSVDLFAGIPVSELCGCARLIRALARLTPGVRKTRTATRSALAATPWTSSHSGKKAQVHHCGRCCAGAISTATSSLAQDVKNPTHEGPGGYLAKVAGAAVPVKTPPESMIVTSRWDDGTDQQGRAADGACSRAWPVVATSVHPPHHQGCH